MIKEILERKGFYDFEYEINSIKHMVLNYFNLAKPFNLNSSEKDLKLIPLNASKESKLKIKELIEYKKDLVGIHPCHEIKEKNYSKKEFAKVIDFLISAGKTPVILGSPKEIKQIKELLELVKEKNKVLNLAGRVPIPETIDLMNYLDFFIANDGGIMHIAASNNLPTLGIFNAETPKKYAPFNRKSFSVLGKENKAEDLIEIIKEYFL